MGKRTGGLFRHRQPATVLHTFQPGAGALTPAHLDACADVLEQAARKLREHKATITHDDPNVCAGGRVAVLLVAKTASDALIELAKHTGG